MRIFREPFFHFLLLGLAIFGWFFWLNPEQASDDDAQQIVIDALDVDRLSAKFEKTWRRAPQEDELRAMLDALVREEVLVREARALGLDQGDSVVRGRLAQKMEFLATSVAQSMVPEDDVLIAYMEENPGAYSIPPMIAFDQLLLAPGVEPSDVISRLNAGDNPDEIASPSLLPRSVPLSMPGAVDSTFGRDVFSQVSQLPVGEWSGPVTSGYGPHVVRVIEYRAPEPPRFEDVREKVLQNWRTDQAEKLTTAQIDALKQKYTIEILSATENAG